MIQTASGDAIFHCIEMSNTIYRQAEPGLRAKIEKFWQSILADSDEHWIVFDETIALWQAALCESGRADAVLAWLDAQYTRLKRDGYERSAAICANMKCWHLLMRRRRGKMAARSFEHSQNAAHCR